MSAEDDDSAIVKWGGLTFLFALACATLFAIGNAMRNESGGNAAARGAAVRSSDETKKFWENVRRIELVCANDQIVRAAG